MTAVAARRVAPGPRATPRLVAAAHGRRVIKPDPNHEIGMAAALAAEHDQVGLQELYRRYS